MKLISREDEMNQKADPFEHALQDTFFDRILPLEAPRNLQTFPD